MTRVDQIGAVESVKAASDIVELFQEVHVFLAELITLLQYAPISGTVQEVNETLASEPGLLNRSPQDKGKG
jgi:glycine cleavage system H protein